MHGFIEITRKNQQKFTVALHTIGVVEPAENNTTKLVLSMGQSGNITYYVLESYEIVCALMKEAQQPARLA